MIRVIALSLLTCGILPGSEPSEKGVTFAKLGERELKLDIYRPDSQTAAAHRPLIVWVHGGAWRAGKRDSVPIKALVEKGFTIASVDYRLSTEAPFPANVHDLKAAIRHLRFHARKYQIDPESICIAGISAGGHLAALVGLTNGSPAHEGEVGHQLETSSDVQSVVSFFGASNLLSILDQSTPHGLKVRVPALKLLLGGSPREKPALAKLASPIEQLDKSDPPVLLIHGDADPQMPIEQSIELQAACKQIGVPCEMVTIQGGQHGGEKFFDEARLQLVARFLSEDAADRK
ncbi:alpha/beta hydrolase fold domain-containing protein [Haloferula chungangensis]|uniref:Alpha/beta hydrolase fold domain-containing protein n=1 Tax=Haloferula chungangensis TaxID=1048331 RepID=A0ABW2LAV1_9BACT